MSDSSKAESNAHKAAAILLKVNASVQDRESAAELLFAYYPLFMRRLKGKFRLKHEDAEEVFSDTVQKFLKSPSQGGNCEAFLNTQLEQCVIDRHRRETATTRRPEAGLVSMNATNNDDEESPQMDFPAPQRLADSVALSDCLEKGYARMKSDKSVYLKVLTMIAEGWSIDEIASALRVSYEAAKDRVYQARLAAKPYFADCKE